MHVKLISILIVFTILISKASAAQLFDNNSDVLSAEFGYQCKCSKSLSKLIEDTVPSIVNISVIRAVDIKDVIKHSVNVPDKLVENYLKHYGLYDKNKSQSNEIKITGSGFLISKFGHIVTNYHLIKDAMQIDVTINSNQEYFYKAVLIGQDPKTDLALIKLNSNKKIIFPFLRFTDSNDIKVGQSIFVIGDAFGYQGSVSQGVISAKNRILGQKFFTTFIQTDASINIGNSGGPMIGMNGKVIAVNTALASISGGNEGVSFAIPSNTVKYIIKTFVENEGIIHKRWLGLLLQSNTSEISQGLKVPFNRGAIVVNEIKGKIKKFDILISLNGKKIEDVNHVPMIVSKIRTSNIVQAVIFRNGKKLNFKIKLEKKHKVFRNNICQRQGILVKNVSKNAKSLSKKGVLVISVKDNSEAYIRGIRQNDIILSINNKLINNINDFSTMEYTIEQIKNNDFIVFLIYRKGYSFYLPIPIKNY